LPQWNDAPLEHAALAEHFPPLTNHEAVVEAERCLFCYDAPCTHACPTHIDIPRFIKRISTGDLVGSARTILDDNLLGATCARVCPVQELCEGACVLGADHKPIAIGRLQRHAMDQIYAADPGVLDSIVHSGHPTGRKVAVIGAGPAGLSCAGELVRRGHAVTVFEKRQLGGGLSTYGIIGLREPIRVPLGEVAMLERLGVAFRTEMELGVNLDFADIQKEFHAVFLATGLGPTPPLGIDGEELLIDGLWYVEKSKINPHALHVGKYVAVIGAGNTAIDCATIARRLGAERVVIVYRRTKDQMTAYRHEYEFAHHEGIEFMFLTQPVRIFSKEGQIFGLRCARVRFPDGPSRSRAPEFIPGSEFFIPADQVVKAIGQQKHVLANLLGLETENGYIRIDQDYRTSMPRVFAGGDDVRLAGSCSTVMAVQDGKLAARNIDRLLASKPLPQGA
jgi:dihydropyrimidine dehydrogenase (NAD+) subunit PreT